MYGDHKESKMNRTITYIMLCGCLAGCGGDSKDQEAALHGRAEDFGDLLVRITDMSEAEAGKALEDFIEPSPDRADRIAQYYRDFSASSKKFKIVSQSVTKIKIGSDGETAEVAYQTTAQSPDGKKIPVEQETKWKLVDGKWYRVVGQAKKKLDLR
jgi:hypothetical protein